MKRTLSTILALSLVFLLTACNSSPEPTTDPTDGATTAPTSAPTEPTREPSVPEITEATSPNTVYLNIPMTAVSSIQRHETTYGESDTVVFEYTYQDIRVLLSDAAVATKINQNILDCIDSTRTEATNLMHDAVAAEPRYPYSLSILYEPMRVDGTVLSLFGAYAVYSGGSVLRSGHGLTYDMTTGNPLTLTDILEDSVTADILCPLVVEALASLPEEYDIFEDYATTVEHRFAADFRNDGSWHLSDSGLCFTFAPYEVAPSSTGFVHAVIPYEQLSGILKDAWFLPERTTPDGTLTAQAFSQKAAEAFDSFAEVCLDRGSDMFLLSTDGIIYDLVIESGFRRGDMFTPESTVFRADVLVPTKAVMLQANSSDTLPLLRISYLCDEGMVTHYLTTDSDGTPLLYHD